MSSTSSSETVTHGNKVIVMTSDEYYNNLSPIKILQPAENEESARRVFQNIEFSAEDTNKENDEVVYEEAVCGTCRFNWPSSSSHACGNFTEVSKKPRVIQINVSRKPRTPKRPTKKKRCENFSIIGVEQGVAKKTATGRIRKRNYVKKSRGPRSTASLIHDAIQKQRKVLKLPTLLNATSDIPSTQEESSNITKPGLLEENLEKASNKNTQESNYLIDLTTPDAIISLIAEPPESTQNYDDILDESFVLELLNQQYGNILDTELLTIGEQDNLDSIESVLPCPSPNYRSGGGCGIPLYSGIYQIKEKDHMDQIETLEDVKTSDPQSYNKFINSSVVTSDSSAYTPFSRHELRSLPEKIFESPPKIREERENLTDISFSNIPRNFSNHVKKINLSEVTCDELHNSVEIKRELIKDSDLVDGDILEVFKVSSDNNFEKQPYAMDPTICITFQDEKNPTNDILLKANRENVLQTTTGEPHKIDIPNESGSLHMLQPHCGDATKSAKDPVTLNSSVWEIPLENIDFNVELSESANEDQNTRSSLSELLDIVLNQSLVLEKARNKAREVVEPNLFETALLNSSDTDSKSPCIIPKETNEDEFFSEIETSDYLDNFPSGVDTSDIDDGTKMIHPDTDVLAMTASISPNFDKTPTSDGEDVQIAETAPKESPKYFLEDLSICGEIAISSEGDESVLPENDIFEADTEKKFVNEGTFETSKKCIPGKSVSNVHCDHSYGLNGNRYMIIPSSKLADYFPTEAVPFPDNAAKITENIYTDTDDVIVQDLATLQPIHEEAGKRREENTHQTSEEPVENMIKRNKMEKTAIEIESNNLIPSDQDKTNVDKQDIPQDHREHSSSSRQAVAIVMTDSEISSLKTRIMDGTINKDEILEIIEGKNLQYPVLNHDLEQRICDARHLGESLNKKIDVMNKTYEYCGEIVNAALKDLDRNATEATVRDVMDTLHFVKNVIDKTFVYYDVRKQKEKKVKYKVISITKKEVPQTQSLPILSKAPLGTSNNVGRKRVAKSSSKLLTRTLYRMNQLLNTLQKSKSVPRIRKPNAFVSKLREIAKKDLSVLMKHDEGEIETSHRVVTNNSSHHFEERNLSAAEIETEPFEGNKVLSSIENISGEDCNVDFKGFTPDKTTPMSKNMKVILSQTDSLNKVECMNCNKNTKEENILNKNTKRISKAKAEKVGRSACKSDKENDITSELTDTKNDGNLNESKTDGKKEVDAKNYIKSKASEKIDTYKKTSKLIEIMNGFSKRSRRSSKKPPGFYSESKMFVQDLPDNNMGVLKYQVDCSKIDVSPLKTAECMELTYELRNDDKPCVILYNKKDEIKTPIFENFKSRCGKYKPDVPVATVQSPPAVLFRKTGKPKIQNEEKKADKPKMVNKIKETDKQKTAREKPGKALRNQKKSEMVVEPPRSLRATKMEGRNAVKEPLKTLKE